MHWSDEPGEDYRDWVARSGLLFSDPAWVEPVARALGSRPLYGFHRGIGAGLAVHRFRRLGFLIAYAGLPITPAWLAASDERARVRIAGAHLTRFNFSSLAPEIRAARAETATALPESVIPDLGSWPVRSARKLKKDRAFASRAGLRVDDLGVEHAAAVERLYRGTVARHGGRLRYGESYFRAAIELAVSDARISARGAFDEASNLAGFTIFCREGATANYLHGGVAPEARKRGASDLLLGDAIDRAIAAGATSVTLLPSPPQQPGLLAFKQKWAERDASWITLDRADDLLGRLALGAMAAGARMKRRLD